METKAENLILGTVNAPWKRSIDGDTLTALILEGEVRDWLPHLATFFSEVRTSLLWEFAEERGIGEPLLLAAYRAVRDRTGEANPDLEEILRRQPR